MRIIDLLAGSETKLQEASAVQQRRARAPKLCRARREL